MRAAILKAPRHLILDEVPTPICPKGGLLVKIQACSICSTDVKMLHHGHRDLVYPRILGHEVTGIIVENHAQDKAFEIGDRVQIAPGLICGECTSCLRGADNQCDDIGIIGFTHDGGFAEFLIVPPKNVQFGGANIIPDRLGFEEATFVEPLACCLNGQELSRVNEGDAVLIFGAGPIGCLHAMLARAMGASIVLVVEILQSRINMVDPVKADRMINPYEESIEDVVKEETRGRGVDVIILACPEATLAYPLLKLLASRGRICLFSGLPQEKAQISIDLNTLHYREISIVGAYGCTIAQNKAALKLISSGNVKVDWLITKRVPLTHIHEGMEHVAQREGLKATVTKF